jgi:uncharacterized protein (TIGR00251 family)
VVAVHLKPGAQSEGISGLHGEALAVKVHAPAHDGRANAALLGLLARQLGVPLASVRLSSGRSSRTKKVLVTGLSAEEVAWHLASCPPAGLFELPGESTEEQAQ